MKSREIIFAGALLVMTVQHFMELFQQYGLPMMAVVFFCEYLNLPGFPAGVIMPAVGILIGQSQMNLFVGIIISVMAGLGGCLVIYFICACGGAPLLHKLFGKSPKFQHFVGECHARLEKGRGRGLMVCRLVPVLRTIVSIPAGLLRMPLKEYVIWSAAGIALWNTAFIGAGYFFSEAFL